jgi:hypothetical protein
MPKNTGEWQNSRKLSRETLHSNSIFAIVRKAYSSDLPTITGFSEKFMELAKLQQPRRYRRVEASHYLRQNWGIERAPSTLAKLACIGGGPRFETAGRIPLYPEPELDEWARSILSPLKSSTSDISFNAVSPECYGR